VLAMRLNCKGTLPFPAETHAPTPRTEQRMQVRLDARRTCSEWPVPIFLSSSVSRACRCASLLR
jgi:hypothetical protein